MNDTPVTKNKYDQLVEIAQYAIAHIDSSSAEKVLGEIKKYFPSLNLSQANPELFNKIENLKIKMQIVTFDTIDDEDAANIFSYHLIDFFNLDIPLEEKITSRYNFLGYAYKNTARTVLRNAILKNQEMLGGLTIGAWLNHFDKKFDTESRSENSIMNFLIADPEAMKLNQKEKSILKNILNVYETLLATEVVDIFDMAVMLNSLENNKAANSNSPVPVLRSPQMQKTDNAANLVTTKFNDALKMNSEVGEQIITSYKINLKMFPEPARPSIKNWLSDYTFNVGFNNRDNLVRSNYLFQSQNAKNLSAVDREKLAYILKAYDENSSITLNTATMQILFPERKQPTEPMKMRPAANDHNKKTTTLSSPTQNIPQKNRPKIELTSTRPTTTASPNLTLRQTKTNYHPLGLSSNREVYEINRQIKPQTEASIPKSAPASRPERNTPDQKIVNLQAIPSQPSRNITLRNQINLASTGNLSTNKAVTKPTVPNPAFSPKPSEISSARPNNLGQYRNSLSPQKAESIINNFHPDTRNSSQQTPVKSEQPQQYFNSYKQKLTTENPKPATPAPTANINFSSPQKMSHEKKQDVASSHPYRISYISDDADNTEEATLPKNVIDLRK